MKFQSRNPNNSRIIIDYRKNKVPVKFEYPNKDKIIWIVCLTLEEIWLKLNLFLGIIYLILTAFFIEPFIPLPNNEWFSIGIILFYFFGPPFVFSIPFTKSDKFLLLMPKINKILKGGFIFFLMKKYYYKKVKKLNTRKFEIEYFDNIFLDYKATKEFSKYLQKVEIKEYEFEIIRKFGFLNYSFKKKKHRQERIWKAIFYFKKIPKTGFLEVEYL